MDFIKTIIKFLSNLFTKKEETKPEPIVETPPKQETPIPEVIMGDCTVKQESANLTPVKKSPEYITINNSRRYSYYTQRNNEIAPNQACNVTSMTMGLLYNGIIIKKDDKWYTHKGDDIYELNKDSLPKVPFKQFEDNLIYFTRKDSRVLEYYSRTYPSLYNDWILECNEVEKKGIDEKKHAFKSYPPNELHLVLSYSVNLFLNGDYTKYETQGIGTIEKRILNGESIVVSGVFQGLNHIVCVCGLQYEKELKKTVGFIIDDPFGKICKYDEGKTGDDSFLDYDSFLKFVKPQNNKEKACHIFKR